MPITPGEPLLKTTLNLYSADVAEFKRLYGDGWTIKIRDLVHEHLPRRQTVEDFMKKNGYADEPYGR